MAIFLRNPLAWPGGAVAGINPDHVALAGGAACRLSAVARNNSFFDLRRGVSGVNFGAPSRVIDGGIGDSVQCAAAAGATFANRATTDPKMTFAAIVKWTNVAASSFSFIFANSTSSTGYNGFFAANDFSLGVRFGSLNTNTTTNTPPILVANNVPYFIAASVGPNANVNFVTVRLDNGLIRGDQVSGTGAYSDTPNGNYVVGNWPSLGTFGMVGRIAAVAYINAYLTLPQMLVWAKAPWDFWYPRSGQLMAPGKGGGAVVVTGRPRRVQNVNYR